MERTIYQTSYWYS